MQFQPPVDPTLEFHAALSEYVAPILVSSALRSTIGMYEEAGLLTQEIQNFLDVIEQTSAALISGLNLGKF